jgi:hypothetical protein
MAISSTPVKSNAIPHWVARHPIFEKEVRGMTIDLAESKKQGLLPGELLNPHGMRIELKRLLHRASRLTLEQIRHGPPGSTADRLSRALAGYRAWRSGNVSYVVKICSHFPEFSSFFDAEGRMLDQVKFHGFLNEIARSHFNKEQDDVINNARYEANDRSRRLTVLQQMSMAWRSCNRRIALTDVLPPEPSPTAPAPRHLDPSPIISTTTSPDTTSTSPSPISSSICSSSNDGAYSSSNGSCTNIGTNDNSPTSSSHDDGDSLTQAAAYLAQYWRQVFARGRTIQAACDHLLDHVPRDLPDYDWSIVVQHFEEAIDHFSSSAPGPDGIPFSALATVGKEFAAVLFEIFSVTGVNYKNVPEDFNEATMVFLPKGTDPNDSGTSAAREPGATRPLTLSNTDSKVFSRVLSFKMAGFATMVVHEAQRGFVRGRYITDNVLEIEGIALSQVAHTESSVALIGFDIKAAFPSLSHVYMWQALTRDGIPTHIVKALKALYHKHRVVLRLAGRIYSGFDIFAGIKQGCPSSGTIFAFALDPFIRYLLHKLPPPALHVRAFADDLGAILVDVLKNFRPLAVAFALLKLATCLAVHPAKTQLALLTNGAGIDVTQVLHEAGGD